jgi:hypothetical protein
MLFLLLSTLFHQDPRPLQAYEGTLWTIETHVWEAYRAIDVAAFTQKIAELEAWAVEHALRFALVM